MPEHSFADRVAQDHNDRLADLTAARASTGPSRADDETSRLSDLTGMVLAGTATFGVTSLVALLVIALVPALILDWTSTVIESSSMQPTIERGDVVVLRPVDHGGADVGAVVRFPADDGGSSIVHRVVEVNTDSGAYVTKGDANPDDDQALVPFGAVDGLGTLLVPLIGHPALWFHEGRFALLALIVAAGGGAVWVGTNVGDRQAGPDGREDPNAGAADLSAAPLSPWSIDRSSGYQLFAMPTEGDAGRGRPGQR